MSKDLARLYRRNKERLKDAEARVADLEQENQHLFRQLQCVRSKLIDASAKVQQYQRWLDVSVQFAHKPDKLVEIRMMVDPRIVGTVHVEHLRDDVTRAILELLNRRQV